MPNEVAKNNHIEPSAEEFSLPEETKRLIEQLVSGALDQEPPIAQEQLLMAVIAFGDSYVHASQKQNDEEARLRELTQMLLAILTDQAADPEDVEKVFPNDEVLSDV